MASVRSEVGEASLLWDGRLMTSGGNFFLKIVNHVPGKLWKLGFVFI
jgi:hypothetical protein